MRDLRATEGQRHRRVHRADHHREGRQVRSQRGSDFRPAPGGNGMDREARARLYAPPGTWTRPSAPAPRWRGHRQIRGDHHQGHRPHQCPGLALGQGRRDPEEGLLRHHQRRHRGIRPGAFGQQSSGDGRQLFQPHWLSVFHRPPCMGHPARSASQSGCRPNTGGRGHHCQERRAGPAPGPGRD